MSRFRISRLAEADIYNIVVYSLATWGEAQADRYISQLDDCCRLLANCPQLGPSCDEIRSGWRRMEHGKHVVFYREEFRGILVCRVLHRRMLPETQDIDDEDDAFGPA